MLLCHFKFSFKIDKLNFRFIGTLNTAGSYITDIFRHFTSVQNINGRGSASCLLKLPRVRTTYQCRKMNVSNRRLELFK